VDRRCLAGPGAHVLPAREPAASWTDYNRGSAPWIGPTAWGLIDFLFHGDEGRWRGNQRALLDALAQGKGSEQASGRTGRSGRPRSTRPQIRALFEALRALPDRKGYSDFFPARAATEQQAAGASRQPP